MYKLQEIISVNICRFLTQILSFVSIGFSCSLSHFSHCFDFSSYHSINMCAKFSNVVNKRINYLDAKSSRIVNKSIPHTKHSEIMDNKNNSS
jgi:hypothetical protein